MFKYPSSICLIEGIYHLCISQFHYLVLFHILHGLIHHLASYVTFSIVGYIMFTQFSILMSYLLSCSIQGYHVLCYDSHVENTTSLGSTNGKQSLLHETHLYQGFPFCLKEIKEFNAMYTFLSTWFLQHFLVLPWNKHANTHQNMNIGL